MPLWSYLCIGAMILLLPVVVEGWRIGSVNLLHIMKVVQREEEWSSNETTVVASSVMVLLALPLLSLVAVPNLGGNMMREQEEATMVSMVPMRIWENEVFGSTIPPVIEHRVWRPGEEAASGGMLDSNAYSELVLPLMGAYETAGAYTQVAGEYAVRVRVRSSEQMSDEAKAIKIEIKNANGQVLAERVIYGLDVRSEYTDHVLHYMRSTVGEAEKIYVVPMAEGVVVDTVEMYSVGEVARQTVPAEYPDVPDALASEGSARLAEPGRQLPGTMMFGPYDATLEPGEYMVKVYVKSDAHDAQHVVTVEAAAIYEKTQQQEVEQREVRGSDLGMRGVYRPVSVPLTVREGGVAEVRVQWAGDVRVLVDRVEIYRSNSGTAARQEEPEIVPAVEVSDPRIEKLERARAVIDEQIQQMQRTGM